MGFFVWKFIWMIVSLSKTSFVTKMRLTKFEKETIILFNESEDEASIYTYNAGLKNRLKKFSRQYPQLCHLKEKNKYGGVEYLIDKSRLSIHFQSPYSEERIEIVTQNLLKRMEHPAE